jgi:DNA sulfur modification protein DndD
MKLIRVEFNNFRLLKDLEIDFSQDPEKHLTIIRAENETGKTTILSAIQWALYGESALPGKNHEYRLHPIDWHSSDGRVNISVAVDFEIPRYRNNQEIKRKYRIVRSTFEEVDGSEWQRGTSSVQLYHLTDRGAEPISHPDAMINYFLPPELREVFFTDGDRALSFIEGEVSQATKRSRVQKAIRSLLGLGVIEDAIKHVKKSTSEINKKARELNGDVDLQGISSKISQIAMELEDYEKKYKHSTEQFSAIEERINVVDKQIAEALKKGDKEALDKELKAVKRDIEKFSTQIKQAQKEHSSLFRGKEIACDLLKPLLRKASRVLNSLHDQGKIPNTTIPVLEERLKTNVCICGESLDINDPQGKIRRSVIEKSIIDSQKADANRKILTDLYYSSKDLLGLSTSDESQWEKKYTQIVERRDSLQTMKQNSEKKLKAIEHKIDSLPHIDIQGLRALRSNLLQQRDRFLRDSTTLEAQIESMKKDLDRLENKRNKLLRQQTKGLRILADLNVAQDIQDILNAAYLRITTDELGQVSTLMNSIFLEMIGADPEQGSIIRRAEITPEFDLKVYGPEERLLNPDRDLNGASRRALTLAFILALTQVSGVEAPNVIDTPLGMMAGYVKRAVLKSAVKESSQLTLFLTRSEIQGCEDILDEKAGKVMTLTNPAHYPKILINDPGTKERKVLRCDCNHNTECNLCARRLDAETEH